MALTVVAAGRRLNTDNTGSQYTVKSEIRSIGENSDNSSVQGV